MLSFNTVTQQLRNDQFKLSHTDVTQEWTVLFQSRDGLCQYLDVYYILSYYFLQMNKKQKKESADTSDKYMLNNTTETKPKIIKQPEDKESSALIWFSLDLGRSVVYSINSEGKEHN